MKTVDLTKLYANDKELSRLTEELKKRYKCDCDDAVHDSYGDYVKEMKYHSDEIHKECEKMKQVSSEIDSVNVDEMSNSIIDLCQRVESL